MFQLKPMVMKKLGHIFLKDILGKTRDYNLGGQKNEVKGLLQLYGRKLSIDELK